MSSAFSLLKSAFHVSCCFYASVAVLFINTLQARRTWLLHSVLFVVFVERLGVESAPFLFKDLEYRMSVVLHTLREVIRKEEGMLGFNLSGKIGRREKWGGEAL